MKNEECPSIVEEVEGVEGVEEGICSCLLHSSFFI
jgi:hypothetical protein